MKTAIIEDRQVLTGIESISAHLSKSVSKNKHFKIR